MSFVADIPAASSEVAIEHFLRRLSVETDCADVAIALKSSEQDFVLLHAFALAQGDAGDVSCFGGYTGGGA